MNTKPTAFYMVYAEGKNTPVYKHYNYTSAKAEARRLSEQLGVKCYVLGTISQHECIKFKEEEIIATELIPMPF